MRIVIIQSAHLRSRTVAAVAALAAIFLIIYLPDLGHGFLKDDFGWVRRARPDGQGFALAFQSDIGFYRPLVMATFAIDHAFWQLNPFGYGMTNLALCCLDATLLYALARSLRLPAAAAIVAAAAWAFNFHGINMGLLWLSGRTALLVVLFALATALAVLRQRHLLAGAFCLCALLSKEEAALIPALWTAFLFLDGRLGESGRQHPVDFRSLAARTWPLWAALAVYVAVRAQSGAFGPLSAPPEYQLFTSTALLARNVTEYADRALTLSAALAIVLLFVAGRGAGAFTDVERRTLLLAGLWIASMFALTISLPVRSSLYAILPSVGGALVAGVVASCALRARPQRFARACAALIVIAALLVPVYRKRNERWVEAAGLSAKVVDVVRDAADRYPAGGRIVLVDDPAATPNFESTFLTAFPEVLILEAGRQWSGEIASPDGRTDSEGAVVVVLEGGEPIVRVWPDGGR